MRPLLGISLLTALACSAPPCPEAPTPAATSAPTAIEPSPAVLVPLPTAAATPAPEPRPQGGPAFTAWMPVDCDGRFYLDVERLLQGQEEHLEALIMPIIGEKDRRGFAADAMKVLRRDGLDPFRSIRALAGCENPDMGVVELVGASSAPLATLRRAIIALHEGQPNLRRGERPMLELPGNDALVEVAPNVLVFTEDRDELGPVLEARGGEPGFREVGDLLVYVQMEEVLFTVRDDGGRWHVRFVLEERARRRAKSRRKAEEFFARAARYVSAKTPLRRLGDALRQVTVGVHPRGLQVEMTIARSDVSDTLPAARTLGADELEDLLEGRPFR